MLIGSLLASIASTPSGVCTGIDSGEGRSHSDHQVGRGPTFPPEHPECTSDRHKLSASWEAQLSDSRWRPSLVRRRWCRRVAAVAAVVAQTVCDPVDPAGNFVTRAGLPS